MKYKGLTIGIPKEIMENENRVAAIPETVKKFKDQGARILVENNAGTGSIFNNDEYETAGAEIISDVKELFNASDIIMKVKEPKFNKSLNIHEIDMMKKDQVLVTFIHPANPSNHDMVNKLADQGVMSLSLDCIPRITRAQSMDALTSMSTVAGYKSVISAANRLPKFMPMIGTAVGMIKPANVLVIGIGVAGLQALATAKRLGAVTYAADIRPDAVEQAASLGARTVDINIPPEMAIGQGGYAKHLEEEWLQKERDALQTAVLEADILILAALIPKKIAPILITEDMVKAMKPGSSIIDISVDQGGNCALTEPGNIVCKHNITIDGTQNIPGSVPSSASFMFAHNIYNLLSLIVDDGKINIDKDDEIIKSALITKNGAIVNKDVAEEIELYKSGALK
ncbi:MAG: NAD(P) transhydrogenase subunit alpha [Thermodesulfobacteriota bacterium]|nr:NAD(P) transhydrogenase subunit alpha [Thermodesulfobacteriota bacterium]